MPLSTMCYPNLHGEVTGAQGMEQVQHGTRLKVKLLRGILQGSVYICINFGILHCIIVQLAIRGTSYRC